MSKHEFYLGKAKIKAIIQMFVVFMMHYNMKVVETSKISIVCCSIIDEIQNQSAKIAIFSIISANKFIFSNGCAPCTLCSKV